MYHNAEPAPLYLKDCVDVTEKRDVRPLGLHLSSLLHLRPMLFGTLPQAGILMRRRKIALFRLRKNKFPDCIS